MPCSANVAAPGPEITGGVPQLVRVTFVDVRVPPLSALAQCVPSRTVAPVSVAVPPLATRSPYHSGAVGLALAERNTIPAAVARRVSSTIVTVQSPVVG